MSSAPSTSSPTMLAAAASPKIVVPKVLFFNHSAFDGKYEEQRKGSEADSKMINECFAHFGVKPKVVDDPRFEKIKSKLPDAFASSPEFGCLLVFISSHGFENVLCARDCPYRTTELFEVVSKSKGPEKKQFF